MKHFFSVALLLMLFLSSVNSQLYAASADVETVANWIKSLQYTNTSYTDSLGAIKIHHSPGFIGSDGNYYFRVVPYNSNLAVLGLLQTSVDGKLGVVKSWMEWYLSHVDLNSSPPGLVYDHWYLADGTGESTCPPGIDLNLCEHDDASDSYAATFLGVARAYYEEGGDTAFMNTAGNKEKFETIAGVILGLQDVDGLTWAKDNFHIKYLMDNSEVYWGLNAMALLEEMVFGDTVAAQIYINAAELVLDGIDTELFNQGTGLYRVAKLENGTFEEANLNNWYPGTVAIVWPLLFIDASSARAQTQMSALNNSWDGLLNPDWATNITDPNGFTWDSIGYAALLTGYQELSLNHVEFVKNLKFPTAENPVGFDWPFSVNDAGWLLSTLSSFSLVSIDIKPGSYPNSINLGSNGNVPVAILSSTTFDATTVVPSTVTLASAPVRLKGKANTPMASFEDVNADGLLDLVVHVDIQSLIVGDTDEIIMLQGETLDGNFIEGEDTIRVIP